jgi:hypothetical protein
MAGGGSETKAGVMTSSTASFPLPAGERVPERSEGG